MSHPARRSAFVLAGLVAVWLPAARAQTIADYSQSQRAWLESSMSRTAVRAAGAAAAASAPAAGATGASSGSLPAPPPARAALSMPAIQVSGVFRSSTGTVAEVVANATAYLLEAGQLVPGTSWQIESVAVDRVVLGRRGAAGGLDGEAARKVFALPPLR